MAQEPHFPRFAEPRLVEALEDSPVVLVHGPRQSGKSTLAQAVGKGRGYEYVTFDEDVARAAAEADPVGFVADLPARAILDEVQRVPSIFTALKREVDRRREPGRFLLTGSSNVLLVPAMADSLAGRMEILRLHPLAQCEIERREPSFLDRLFREGFEMERSERLGKEVAERIVAGGFPPALARRAGQRREAWYRDYVEALVQRDVREVAQLRDLDALERLLGLVASHSACLLNVSELAAPFELSRPTIRDYLVVLGRLFLVETLRPWHSNRLNRLIKTPKLHIGDTGLACALLGVDADFLWSDRALLGRLLETFVFLELLRQASFGERTFSFSHFREKDGREVDIVIEQGARGIAGIEVKAAATVTGADFSGLRKLQDTCGDRFKMGVVLYDGDLATPFGDRLYALPIRILWGP